MMPRTYLAYVSDCNHPTVIRAYSWQDARDQAKDMYGPKLVSVRAPDSVGQDAYAAGLRRAQELAKEHALIKHEHNPDEYYGCGLYPSERTATPSHTPQLGEVAAGSGGVK